MMLIMYIKNKRKNPCHLVDNNGLFKKVDNRHVLRAFLVF